MAGVYLALADPWSGRRDKPHKWGALCFILGELFAIAIIVQFLATPGLGVWSLTLSVAFWTALIILLAERVKPISSVPAYFQGAGLFFAAYFYWWPVQEFTAPGNYVTVTILVALSMAFGFLNGWLTVWLYGLWGRFYQRFETPDEADTEALAEA